MNKLNAFLLIIALVSGLGVVYIQDKSRQSFILLDKAEEEELQLEQVQASLKLKQANLSNLQLIKQIAETKRLHFPEMNETKMIEKK